MLSEREANEEKNPVLGFAVNRTLTTIEKVSYDVVVCSTPFDFWCDRTSSLIQCDIRISYSISISISFGFHQLVSKLCIGAYGWLNDKSERNRIFLLVVNFRDFHCRIQRTAAMTCPVQVATAKTLPLGSCSHAAFPGRKA